MSLIKEFVTNIVIGGRLNPNLQKAFSIASKYASKTAEAISKTNEKAVKSASNINSKMGGLHSGLNGLYKKAAQVGAAIGAIKIGKTMIDQAANMEQYRQTLNVVMKDSKKAAKTMAWAVDFANRTPFETDEVVNATVKLQSYGIQAQKTLPLIGDMAGVMGKSMDQAVEAIADAQTGELERLKEFGIKKEQIVAQANKKLAGIEVVNSKGQIVNQEAFNLALFDLMKERYKGGMDLQAKSFKGLMSTISGVVKNGLATIAGVTATGEIIDGSVFDVIKKKASGLADILIKLAGSGVLEKVGQVVGSGLGTVINIIDSIGSEVWKVFSNIGSSFSPFFIALDKGTSLSQAFYEGLQNILGKDFAAVIADFVGYAEFGVKGIISFLQGNTTKAADLFYTMFPDEAGTQGKVKNIITFLQSTSQNISKAISNIIDCVKVAVVSTGKIIESITPYVKKIIDITISASSKILPVVDKVIQAIRDTIVNAAPIIVEIIDFIYKRVSPIVTDLIEFIVNNIVPVITNVVNKVIEIVPKVVPIFQIIWSVIQSVASNIINIINFIMPFVQNVVLGIISSIGDSIHGLITIIGGIIDFISGVFTGNWSRVWQGVVDIFAGIFETIGGVVKTPINAVIGIINGAIANINKVSIDVPDWVPGLGGKHFGVNIPQIPMLAKGGITNTPSICGEAGPEAVIPLKPGNSRSIDLFNKTAKYLGIKSPSISTIEPLQAAQPRNISVFNNKQAIERTNSNQNPIQIIYSPNIGNGANNQEINKQLEISFEQFKTWFEQLEHEKVRLNYD